ncbi:Hypothetical predicted protein, partial [Mytilus galloprovincialis]
MATRLEMKLLVTELQRDKIAKFIEDQGWTDIVTAPCVAVSNESAPWIGEGQQPSVEKTGIRKEIYKRFWKIMDNLGVWYTEDYLDRKKNIGG